MIGLDFQFNGGHKKNPIPGNEARIPFLPTLSVSDSIMSRNSMIMSRVGDHGRCQRRFVRNGILSQSVSSNPFNY